jgi:hypothetical protein
MTALRPRTGVQVPYPQTVAKTILPIAGMWTTEPTSAMPLGASPDMLNFRVTQGCLRKRPGFVQFPVGAAAFGAEVMGLYNFLGDDGTSRLYAATPTGILRWTGTVWQALTGTALTGTTSQPFSFANSQGAPVFSQGTDAVQIIDVASDSYAALDDDCPPARYLCRFADRLYLAYTFEGGTGKARRIRWCANADHTDWTGIGASYRDELEIDTFLRGMKRLGTGLAVYFENGMLIAGRTGGVPPAAFDQRYTEVGLLAPRTLQAYRRAHWFLGPDSFYEFDGVDLLDIAENIRDEIFATLNPGQLARMFSLLVYDTQEYCNFLASGTSDWPDKVWVYNWGKKIWYPWATAGMTCGTLFSLVSAPTIDELTEPIDSYPMPFDSRSLLAAYPAIVTGNADGKVYIWSPLETSDNGVAIPCHWTSRDLTAGLLFGEGAENRQITVRRVGFTYEDVGIDLSLDFSFSTNGGESWDGPYRVTCVATGGGWHEAHIDRQVTGDRVRFKIENISATQLPIISRFVVDAEIRGQLT